MSKRDQLKIEETNMALSGSDLEKKVREAAARKEPSWEGAGQAVGTEIWRIEKFNVVSWPKERYGEFFDGDSYIVLNTFNPDPANPDKLAWDVHFWLGTFTTQDEAGTAAYKTVELDDLLGGSPVQHRQVQGAEDDSFLKLFPGRQIKVLEGGVDSGFKHVEAGSGNKAFPTRIFQMRGTNMRNVKAYQVPPKAASLNEGDAFVVDSGDAGLFVFQGTSCSPGERSKASNFAQELADQRKSGGKIEVVNSEDAPDSFWDAIGGKADISADGAAGRDRRLFQLSDASGEMQFTPVAEGANVKPDLLSGDDVFVLDNTYEIFVWVGKGASPSEKLDAMPRAQGYINQAGLAPTVPITRMVEGLERPAFLAAVA